MIEELRATVRKGWQGPLFSERVEEAEAALAALAAHGEMLECALELIAAQQPLTLAMIAANGFVFDEIGCEPGNWQHLAFTIYSDLCKMDSVARFALAGPDGKVAV